MATPNLRMFSSLLLAVILMAFSASATLAQDLTSSWPRDGRTGAGTTMGRNPPA